MKFRKVVEQVEDTLLVYFVDQKGNKQGSLFAYNVLDPVLIREENLIYTQEYLDNELVGEKTFK